MPACAQCGAPVPADARFCPTCAAPIEQDPKPAEERKLATVLFADLVGSTELAGSQDPERTRVLLDRFYDAMAEEIERGGGTVEKFVGDAVMAAFGAPGALEDHAERALHVALAMQRRLTELFGDRLALRIGVNTGEVVVGRAREGSSFVTGDAVNVGARLEQAAAPGEIFVGERTAAAVRGAFELSEPVTIEAKGKPEGVVCRRLVRALSLMRPRGVGGLQSALVGRDREFEELRETYARIAADGAPQLVTIIGDAGVGKTRLVRELWSWLAQQSPQPVQRTGRCLSYGHGITYWPLVEVLREHLGVVDTDPPHVVLERLGDHRSLAMTLGLDLGEELHPLAARERLHDAWTDFLGELVQEKPAVLLIEDLHWAEDDLCDLIETLVRQADGPLMVLATARPELLERRPGWGRDRHSSHLVLDVLTRDAAVQLLEQLLGVALPAALRDVVVARAEGNPFFVEELVATLIDRGVIERRNGSWSYKQLPEGFEVPDTVQAVLAARIDLLPAANKAALQAASVIGRVFWTGPVYELVDDSAAADFGVLEEREFVRRRAGSSLAGEREYVIKHALTREVAYSSLPKAKRAQLHAAFARWLERRSDATDEHAALLAHHYAEAVRPQDLDLAWAGREEEVQGLRRKAVEWARRAAALAIGRYEIDEGLTLLRRAVELETNATAQGELWFEIGRAAALKYDGEQFTGAMERAIKLGAPAAEVRAEIVFQMIQRFGMWVQRPDIEVFRRSIAQALELAPPRSAPRAKALIANATWFDVEADAREAIEIAEELDDVELRSHALGAAAAAAWGNGDYVRAAEIAQRRTELVPRISDPDHVAHTWWVAARQYSSSGRFADADDAVGRLEAVAEGLSPHHRIHGIGTRVELAALAGRWEEVLRLTSRVEPAVEANLETPCPLNITSLLDCATASAHHGDLAESRRLEAKADGIGMVGYGVSVHPPQLRLGVARRDLDALRVVLGSLDEEEELAVYAYNSWAALLDALVALGDAAGIEARAPMALRAGPYVEPFALRALGVAHRDDMMLRDAVGKFDAMGLEWHAGETRKLVAPRS
jgi:class 3 adenylate cyclase